MDGIPWEGGQIERSRGGTLRHRQVPSPPSLPGRRELLWAANGMCSDDTGGIFFLPRLPSPHLAGVIES